MTKSELKKLRSKLKHVNGGAFLEAVQSELEATGKAVRDKKWISKVLNGHAFSFEIVEAAVSVADKNEAAMQKLRAKINAKPKKRAA